MCAGSASPSSRSGPAPASPTRTAAASLTARSAVEKELTVDKFQIDKTKGFALAAALVSLNPSLKDRIISPEVGELQFYLKSWNEEVNTI